MTGYRFLPPAEEEMIEASLFYEQGRRASASSFLTAFSALLI